MEALLVAPPEARYVRAFSIHEYLGIGYLASYAAHHGCEVEIHNCNCRAASSIEKVVERATISKPPIIGITIPTLPNLPAGVHIVRALRGAGYTGHITMGGHVPTFQYAELLGSVPGLTSIVYGEGEETFRELVSHCASGTEWRDIPGLAYQKGDMTVRTPPRTLIADLDSLPFPKRALTNVDEKIISRVAEVSSSRGCYGHCTFCSIASFYAVSPGKSYRYRSAENVVDELEWLVNEYGIHTVIFVDDNFMGTGRVGKRRVEAIADLILERNLGINFNITCRANDIDIDIFSKLKKAGLSRVFVGIESGVDSALNRYRKHITVQENIRALSVLDNLDIRWDMGFMIYDPDTNFEELKENVNFLRKNRFYYFNAATLLLNGMVIFPGTDVEAKLVQENRLKRQMRDVLEFMGTNTVDYDQALRFVNQTYLLRDFKTESMREMIDFSYEKLTPIYDSIWPWIAEFERWVVRASHVCQIDSERIIAALGETGEVYHALLHWVRGMGMLVMNLLEDMVSLVEDGKDIHAFQEIFQQRVSGFLQRGYTGGLSAAVSTAEEFFSQKFITLTVDGSNWIIAVASDPELLPC